MSQDGMQEKRQSRRRNLYRSADDSDISGQSKDQVVLCLCLWHFLLHTWRQLRPYAHGVAAKTCRKMYARKRHSRRRILLYRSEDNFRTWICGNFVARFRRLYFEVLHADSIVTCMASAGSFAKRAMRMYNIPQCNPWIHWITEMCKYKT